VGSKRLLLEPPRLYGTEAASSSPPFKLSLILASKLAPKLIHPFHLLPLLLLTCVPGHFVTVRVSFMCQLGWPWRPRQLVGGGSGYVLEGSVDRVSQGPPRVCVLGGWGALQSLDPSMAQKVEEEQAFPSANPTSICSCPEMSGTLLSGLSCFEIHTGTQRTG